MADVDIDHVAGSFSFGLASVFDLCWFPSGGCTLVTLSPTALCCLFWYTLRRVRYGWQVGQVEELRSGIQALFRKDSQRGISAKQIRFRGKFMMSRLQLKFVFEHCS